MMAGSYRVPGMELPNDGVSQAPQLSRVGSNDGLGVIPSAWNCGFCEAGLIRSQLGTKSTFLSFQTREVCVTSVTAGLFICAKRIESCSTLRLALPLIAVLPLPKRS